MKNIKFMSIVAVVCAMMIALAAVIIVHRNGSDEPVAGERAKKPLVKKPKLLQRKLSPPADVRSKVREGLTKGKKAKRKRTPRSERTFSKEVLSQFSKSDQVYINRIQDASDNGDYKRVVQAFELAQKAKNPEVRRAAVDALGWFGEEALPELTAAMADADADVVETAREHWERAVVDMDDAAARFSVTTSAFAAMKDEESIETISFEMARAANDLINDDEGHASENRLKVLQQLVDFIEGEGFSEAQVAKAKEVYSDVTLHDWISVSEAESYLENPDDYEPPEAP